MPHEPSYLDAPLRSTWRMGCWAVGMTAATLRNATPLLSAAPAEASRARLPERAPLKANSALARAGAMDGNR